MIKFDNQLEEQLKILSSESRFKNALDKPENFYRIIENMNMENLAALPQNYTNTPEVDEENFTNSRGKKIMFLNGPSAEKGSRCFLCKVCSSYLKKGKVPPKAVVNCLEAVVVPENVRLRSYLEQALVARILLFIKIFSLRTSLIPAIKDKCVVYSVAEA